MIVNQPSEAMNSSGLGVANTAPSSVLMIGTPGATTAQSNPSGAPTTATTAAVRPAARSRCFSGNRGSGEASGLVISAPGGTEYAPGPASGRCGEPCSGGRQPVGGVAHGPASARP